MKEKKRENIKINIYEQEVYAEYGVDDKEMFEDSLIDTVEKLANSKPLRTDIALQFVCEEGIEVEQERFKVAFKNTGKNKLETKKRELARCLITGVIMAVFALALLAGYHFLHPYIEDIVFWNELCDVAVWVFMWAAVEILTIEAIQILIEMAKIKRVLRAKIEFVEKKKKVRKTRKTKAE